MTAEGPCDNWLEWADLADYLDPVPDVSPAAVQDALLASATRTLWTRSCKQFGLCTIERARVTAACHHHYRWRSGYGYYPASRGTCGCGAYHFIDLGTDSANARGNGFTVDGWHVAGNGRNGGGNLAQATGAARPTYSTNATKFGGRAALSFDGVNDRLATANFSSSLAAPYTFVAIVSRNGSDGGGNPRLLTDDNADGLFIDFPTVGHFGLFAGTTGITGPVYDANAHLLVGYVHSGATSFLAMDGAAGTTGTTGTGAAINFCLGGSGGFSNCSFAFAGLYPGDFTADTNYAAFKTWAAAYYRLTLA